MQLDVNTVFSARAERAGSRRSLQMQIHPYHSLGADIRLLPLNLAIFG